ncbi:unnamed protein product, partial [Candidula unifasciata]
VRMDTYFRQRLQRRFYYGDMSNLDVPSLPLTELAVDYFHDSVPEKLGHVDMFSASNVIRRNHVSPCSVVLSMLYAKRLRQQRQQQKELRRTMSSADVFFISMMMASKYMYDEGVDEEVFNDEWADNTDQDVDEVNEMEADFLQAMDWKLFVQPREFEDTLAAIERRLALQEGCKRGWFTYTELDVLMSSDLLWALWENIGSECSKLLTAISAAYVTSVLSMLGSTALAIHISGQLSSITLAVFTLHSSALTSTVYPQLANVSHVMWMSPSVSPPEDNHALANRSLSWDVNEHTEEDSDLDSLYKDDPEVDDPGNGSGEPQDDMYRQHGSPASARSSLWILLSQVWAAICIRIKHTYYMETPGDGSHDVDAGFTHVQILQQMNDKQEHFNQASKRRTRLPSTASHKADTDIKLLVTPPALASGHSPSHCCVCSCDCTQVTSAPVDRSAQDRLQCQFVDGPDCPHRLDSSVFQVTGQGEDHCSCHGCTRAKADNRRHTSQSLCLQALTDASADCQFQAEHQSSLLAVPVGFITSVYQSLMVT